MGEVTTDEGITLAYATHGDPGDPPLLLIPGFGSQLISWPPPFLEGLVRGGHHVVVYDNRDCGRSSKLTDRPADVAAISAAIARGAAAEARRLAPYTLSDMARDGCALLDALGLGDAHVLGVSMGAMIAQTMAIEHPARVRTLTSVMSHTGEPGYGEGTPEALAVLLAPPPADREQAVAAAERTVEWRSRRWPGLDRARRIAGLAWDRDHSPGATGRQLAAMVASGSRADGLRGVTAPTLVIHGRDDTLIPQSGGERTAALVPGARLTLLDDMGHDLPEPLWPALGAAILEHTGGRTGGDRPGRAGAPRPTAADGG